MKTSESLVASIVVFDLDNTLAPSKEIIDQEMAQLLISLMTKRKVAVISGGSYPQFEKELLQPIQSNAVRLGAKDVFSNLHIFPTDGTAYYVWNKSWELVYQEKLLDEQKQTITQAIETAIHALPSLYVPSSITYGPLIEDRASQVTFSGLGQNAPLEYKKAWDADTVIRKAMKLIIEPLLPEYEVTIAGTTSIDITLKNRDKAYGIEKIISLLSIPKEKILFIGDALFAGGNDEPVIKTGVRTIQVNNPDETKQIIKNIINDL